MLPITTSIVPTYVYSVYRCEIQNIEKGEIYNMYSKFRNYLVISEHPYPAKLTLKISLRGSVNFIFNKEPLIDLPYKRSVGFYSGQI